VTAVVATIPVPRPPRRVAVAPTGTRAYVTLDEPGGAGGVAVLDTEAHAVRATLDAGRPAGIAVPADGTSVLVAALTADAARTVVLVLDPETGAARTTIPVAGRGGAPTGLAVLPGGERVVVACERELAASEEQGTACVVGLAAGAVEARIAVGPFPAAVAATPDDREVYVLDTAGDPAVIDTATLERSFPFGSAPTGHRIAFVPDGSLAYAILDADTQINVLDPGTHALRHVLPASGLTTDVAVTPDGSAVYVTQRTRHQLSVLRSGVVASPEHPVAWAGTADGIAIAPDGRTAYVADRQACAVRVVALGG
jgi:DNA-binding beta-propeller fold protein YncE